MTMNPSCVAAAMSEWSLLSVTAPHSTARDTGRMPMDSDADAIEDVADDDDADADDVDVDGVSTT